MKHSIYITIEEFLANGGILKNDRGLFMPKSDAQLHPIGWYDEDIQATAQEGTLIVSKTDRTFQTDPSIVFVEVQVNVIYK